MGVYAAYICVCVCARESVYVCIGAHMCACRAEKRLVAVICKVWLVV